MPENTTPVEKELEALKDEPSVTIVLDGDGKGETVKEGDDAKQAIEQLRRRLQEEQQARVQWQAQALESNKLAWENAVENGRNEMGKLTTKLQNAFDCGDMAQVATIQSEMTRLSRNLADMEDSLQRVKQHPRQVDPRTQEDQFLATQDRSNREIILAHRDKFFGDKSVQARMIAASNHAVHNMGLRTDDPRYREFIEQEAGLRPKTESRRSSTPTTTAAPPSRYVPGTGAANPRTITLTKEQRDIARFMFQDSPDPDLAMAQRIRADHAAGLCDLQGRYK